METTLFKSDILHIERFVLHPDEARFKASGFVAAPIAVFPKNPIWIAHDGQPAFVADSSLVNFYNQDQVYHRQPIHPQGDYCHSYEFAADLLAELVPNHQPLHSIFGFQHLPCSRQTFINHLQILQDCEMQGVEDLQIEESAINLLQDVVAKTQNQSEIKITSRKTARHRQLVESVKSSLQQNLDKNITLHSLARNHHISPFHLSRVFKHYSGIGISQYRTRQRLRSASYEILAGSDLTSVAVNHGFVSHSHFGQHFKHYFGITPKRFREAIH